MIIYTNIFAGKVASTRAFVTFIAEDYGLNITPDAALGGGAPK